jgi:hypothetical protein
MLVVIDEDVDVAVGAVFAEGHEVRYVTDVLGPGTPDSTVVAYCRAEHAVLVTSDRALATVQRQRKRTACLYLRDLGTSESARVTALLSTIEAEHAQLGDRFWMQVSQEIFVVAR